MMRGFLALLIAVAIFASGNVLGAQAMSERDGADNMKITDGGDGLLAAKPVFSRGLGHSSGGGGSSSSDSKSGSSSSSDSKSGSSSSSDSKSGSSSSSDSKSGSSSSDSKSGSSSSSDSKDGGGGGGKGYRRSRYLR